MRNFAALLIIFSLAIRGIAAQEPDTVKAIMINPLGIIGSIAIEDALNINFSYENKISQQMSYLINIDISNFFISGLEDNNSNSTAKLR